MKTFRKYKKKKITSFRSYLIERPTFNEGPKFSNIMKPFTSYFDENKLQFIQFHESINQRDFTDILSSYRDKKNMTTFNGQKLYKRPFKRKANKYDRDAITGCFVHDNPTDFKKHVEEFSRKNKIIIKKDFYDKIDCASQNSKNNSTSILQTSQDQNDIQPLPTFQFNNTSQSQNAIHPFPTFQFNDENQDQDDFESLDSVQFNNTSQSQSSIHLFPTVQLNNTSQSQNAIHPFPTFQFNNTSQSQNAIHPFPTFQFNNTSQDQNNTQSLQTAQFNDTSQDQDDAQHLETDPFNSNDQNDFYQCMDHSSFGKFDDLSSDDDNYFLEKMTYPSL